MKKTHSSEEIVIRRIKASEFDQAFKLVSDAFWREIEIAGLDVHRLKRMTRFYRIISGFLFLFDIFHIDFQTLLVALSRNKVVGIIHLIPHGKKIWSIDSVAVDPQFRRRGIYRNLMREAIKYVTEKRGERIIQSIHTDNVAPVRVADELKFEVFEEKSLFYAEIGTSPFRNVKNDIIVRAFKPTDIEQVFEICKMLDSERTEAYRISPEDFLEHFSSRIRKKLAHVHSEKWVVDLDGKVVGYASVAYTSPEEAGNIESFYLIPRKDYSELASVLLKHVVNFLSARNIKKVIVSLNKEWRETVDVFQNFGFKHTAFSYETIKKLAQRHDPLTQGSFK